MSVDIDARGLQCPWPALRLARIMRRQSCATIVADDPVAPKEIAALAEEHGWDIGAIETEIGNGFAISRNN